MKKLRAVPLIAMIATMSAFAAKPQIQWNQSYDFQGIRTFAWQPSTGTSLETRSPFLHQHIINTIEFYLSDSGLTEVESNPDVLVTYYGSVDTEVQLQSDTFSYGWGGYGMGSWGYYGYGFGGPVSTTTRVVEYQRGTLVIDIVDARSNELIWRGSVSDLPVSDDQSKLQKTITKALAKMVKQSRKLRAQAQG